LTAGEAPRGMAPRPAILCRPHKGVDSVPPPEPYPRVIAEDGYEIMGGPDYPPLRVRLLGKEASLTLDRGVIKDLFYRVEARRGYDSQGVLWSPGYFSGALRPDNDVTLIASTEPWATIYALSPRDALPAEIERRE